MQASSLGWYLHGQPAPLLDLELDETTKVKNTDTKLVGKLTSSGRSFTSFQMVHTHTETHKHRDTYTETHTHRDTHTH